jgi:tetratricopeptide (TPR) repeat protein
MRSPPIFVTAGIILAVLAGCADRYEVPPAEAAFGREVSDQVFASAIGLLNTVDDFQSEDALVQVVNRLNQWIAVQQPIAHWQPDPLVAELPQELRDTPLMKSLGELRFAGPDGLALEESVWLREAARFAVGSEIDPLERAKLLFDWTIREIELDEPSSDSSTDPLPRLPWQIMLVGRATAEERAWIFALLARQQGLDVVLLAAGGDAAKPTGLAALLHGGELYLFDALLGVPIPAVDGHAVATLAAASVDQAVLEQLRIDDDSPYRLTPAELKSLVALIPASPQDLSERMALVEARLAGPQHMALVVDASGLAAELEKTKQVSDVRLWQVPIGRRRANTPAMRSRLQAEFAPLRAVRGQVLWKARVLHLCGRLSGEHGALAEYQRARPSNDDINLALATKRLEKEYEPAIRGGKLAASYWLGVASLERDNLDAAIDYFKDRVLAIDPESPWSEGARYNLARTYEALGRNADAIRTYQNTHGPQRPGNLWRARQLAIAAKKNRAANEDGRGR